MVSAKDALKRLQLGNQRFVNEVRASRELTSESRRIRLVEGQEPFAIIYGCSDSRVPAELIFDQGLGDLFVIRVAGNVVAPSLIGSVEFAASKFGTRLVVVLGHTQCGAILSTVEELENPALRSPNLQSIVERVRPAILPLFETELRHNHDELVAQAGRANVCASAIHLAHGSRILEDLIENQGLAIVSAEYSLETGVVEFFDGLPT